VRERIRSTLQLPSAQWAVDLALAVLAALVNVAAALGSDPTTAYQYADGGTLHLVLAAAGGLVLWWRRSHPLITFAVSTTLVAVVAALEWQIGAMPFAWLAAAYALGAYASTRRGCTGIAFAAGAGVVLVIRQAPYFDSWLALGTLGQLLLIWLLGCVVHARRTTAEVARARALDAARVAGLAAEEAARAERRRVARDLHDAVTNSLSVVTVQAAAIRQAFPGTLDGPLQTIEDTSRTALADLRRMLGALRGSQPIAGTGDRPTGVADDLEASVARSTGWTATARFGSRRYTCVT
jgi:signal transduction histidine kinase